MQLKSLLRWLRVLIHSAELGVDLKLVFSTELLPHKSYLERNWRILKRQVRTVGHYIPHFFFSTLLYNFIPNLDISFRRRGHCRREEKARKYAPEGGKICDVGWETEFWYFVKTKQLFLQKFSLSA